MTDTVQGTERSWPPSSQAALGSQDCCYLADNAEARRGGGLPRVMRPPVGEPETTGQETAPEAHDFTARACRSRSPGKPHLYHRSLLEMPAPMPAPSPAGGPESQVESLPSSGSSSGTSRSSPSISAGGRDRPVGSLEKPPPALRNQRANVVIKHQRKGRTKQDITREKKG